MIKWILGEVDLVDNFSYGENTGSWHSCSTTINGIMMIYGSQMTTDFQTQISIVESCRLRRIGDLPMEYFGYGGCNFYKKNDGNEINLLCFGLGQGQGYKNCHR